MLAAGATSHQINNCSCVQFVLHKRTEDGRCKEDRCSMMMIMNTMYMYAKEIKIRKYDESLRQDHLDGL